MPPPHRPPKPPARVPQTPADRRDIAIASAAQAFAVLCEALTEAADLLTSEFKAELEDKRK
jgi:hypothetical protein